MSRRWRLVLDSLYYLAQIRLNNTEHITFSMFISVQITLAYLWLKFCLCLQHMLSFLARLQGGWQCHSWRNSGLCPLAYWMHFFSMDTMDIITDTFPKCFPSGVECFLFVLFSPILGEGNCQANTWKGPLGLISKNAFLQSGPWWPDLVHTTVSTEAMLLTLRSTLRVPAKRTNACIPTGTHPHTRTKQHMQTVQIIRSCQWTVNEQRLKTELCKAVNRPQADCNPGRETL